jgi:curved DNA-binding protein CbpA
MTAPRNPYRELGVAENAPDAAIAARYRSLAQQLHPDVSGGDPKKVERFKHVTAAYNALKTPVSRARVDADLRSERQQQAAAAAMEVLRRKRREAAEKNRAARRAKRAPRVVPTYVPVVRPKRTTPARPAPTSFSQLAVAIARKRPRSETLWWVLGGAAADYLWTTSR